MWLHCFCGVIEQHVKHTIVYPHSTVCIVRWKAFWGYPQWCISAICSLVKVVGTNFFVKQNSITTEVSMLSMTHSTEWFQSYSFLKCEM